VSSEVSFEWDDRTDAVERLAKELCAGIGAPVPDPTDGEDRPRTVGAVAARRDGALLGWAWVYEDPDDERGARVQALYAPRDARRIKTGYYAHLPPVAEEFEVVTGLYRRAAEQARFAHYRTLRWSGPDSGPDGRAAAALHAHGHSEYARAWNIEPLRWHAPAGLSDVRVRRLPEPDLTLATAYAQVSTAIEGHRAYVNGREAIRHQNAEPRALAALIAKLITCLRHDYPEVTELTVWEFDDAAVRQALPLAGMRIAEHFMQYELALTPS
jgi:hypothetical protein